MTPETDNLPGEFGGPCATRGCDGLATSRSITELDDRGAATPYRCSDCSDELDDLARFEAEEAEWRKRIPFPVLALGGLACALVAVGILYGFLAILVALFG